MLLSPAESSLLVLEKHILWVICARSTSRRRRLLLCFLLLLLCCSSVLVRVVVVALRLSWGVWEHAYPLATPCAAVATASAAASCAFASASVSASQTANPADSSPAWREAACQRSSSFLVGRSPVAGSTRAQEYEQRHRRFAPGWRCCANAGTSALQSR
jgi:hypothetical protein